MAKLNFKYGVMNSGKTDTLIKTAYNYTEQGLAIVVVKPAVDTKGGTRLVSRAGTEREADVLVAENENLRDKILSMAASHASGKLDCVLVDEAQFLRPEQVDQLYEIAKADDISVIAYGLRTDFTRRLFPGSQRLLELADTIEKLPTMCTCGSQAEFTLRKINNRAVFSGDTVSIDDSEGVSYEPKCGRCYLQSQREATQ